MPVNAQELFETAIDLMDESDEATGRKDTPETRTYKRRAIGILNLLGRECAQAVNAQEDWRELRGFQEPLELHEGLAREVLPYGLAAHLFLEEDPAAAAFFQKRYEELLARWVRRAGAQIEEIPLPYGGLDAQGDGGWADWL